MFDTPDWAEEAPHSQLNGGSDPVVVTATHVVDHGRDGGGTGATLRLKVFNATNARLQGFSVRLSFGQGGEAAGMAAWGGRVERVVNEVRWNPRGAGMGWGTADWREEKCTIMGPDRVKRVPVGAQVVAVPIA